MRVGESTYVVQKKVYMEAVATIAGSYEGKGSLHQYIDSIIEDDMWGCKTHEMAEIKMQKTNIQHCLDKAAITQHDLDCIVGGDLINQIVPTSFSAREFEVPFMGLYNACATFGESLIVASNLINNDMNKVIAITSSHFATAESLEEAAQIDGCGKIRFFLSVVVPLSGTLIAILTLFCAVSHWNSYFNAILYINERKLYPLQLILREILVQNQVAANEIKNITDIEGQAALQKIADSMKYSLIIISTLPILVVYPFLQKYFVKGVMIGSVKG